MAKEKKTAKELAALIREETGEPPGEIKIFPLRGGEGWSGALITARIQEAAEYQRHIDLAVSRLKQRYDLKT